MKNLSLQCIAEINKFAPRGEPDMFKLSSLHADRSEVMLRNSESDVVSDLEQKPTECHPRNLSMRNLMWPVYIPTWGTRKSNKFGTIKLCPGCCVDLAIWHARWTQGKIIRGHSCVRIRYSQRSSYHKSSHISLQQIEDDEDLARALQLAEEYFIFSSLSNGPAYKVNATWPTKHTQPKYHLTNAELLSKIRDSPSSLILSMFFVISSRIIYRLLQLIIENSTKPLVLISCESKTSIKIAFPLYSLC